MRIDVKLPSTVQVDKDVRKTKVGSKTASAETMGSDLASLSADSTSFDSFLVQLQSLPEMRQERVASLRLAVQNGTYECNASNTATAMLADFYNAPGNF